MRKFLMVQISGVPYVFGNLPSYTYAGYTYKPLLKEEGGVSEQPDTWDLWDGSGTAGTVDLELINEAGFLHWLFAVFRTTIAKTQIMDDMPWESADIASLEVIDSSAFAASGYAYRGLETVAYVSKPDGTHLGTVSRGELGSPVLHHRIEGTDDETRYGNPYLTDQPTEWGGRYVTLWWADVDEWGIVGALSVYWRGVLNEVTCDGTNYLLRAASLLSLMEQQVGLQATWMASPVTTGNPDTDIGLFWYLSSDFADRSWFSFTVGGANGGIYYWRLEPGVYSTLYDLIPVEDIQAWLDTLSLSHAWFYCSFDVEGEPGTAFMQARCDDSGSELSCKLQGDPDFMAALGFPQSVELPYDEMIKGEHPFARGFHSQFTDRLYLTDPSVFAYGDLTIGDRYVAVKFANDKGEYVNIYQILGAQATYLEVAQVFAGTSLGGGQRRALWCSDAEQGMAATAALHIGSIDPFVVLRMLLVSRGGDATNSAYDRLRDWGLSMPSTFIDAASFLGANGATLPLENLILTEPISLGELFKANLQLATVRPFMKNGTLALLACRPDSGMVGDDTPINHTDIQEVSPAVALDPEFAFSGFFASYNWDPGTGEFGVQEEPYYCPEAAARSSASVGPLTIEHKALYLATEDALNFFPQLTADLFRAFGQGVFSIEFTLLRDIEVTPGDLLLLTHPLMLNPASGTAGVTNLRCLCWEVAPIWDANNVRVRALLFPPATSIARWAPAAICNGYNPVTGVFDVNTGSFEAGVNDAKYFSATDKVRIFNQDDESDYVNATISSVGATSLTIDAGLAYPGAGTAPTNGDVMRFRDWSIVQSSQKEWCAIADHSDDLLESTDPPFVFGNP